MADRLEDRKSKGKKGKSLAEMSGWNPRISERKEQGSWIADWWEPKEGGGYFHRKKQLPTRPELEAWIDGQHKQRIEERRILQKPERRGDNAVTLANLTPTAKAAIVSAIAAMNAAGGSVDILADAVKSYAQTHLTGAKKKIWRIAGEHLRAVRQRRRAGTFQDRRRILALLVSAHGRKLAATFSTAQAEDWIYAAPTDSMRVARRRAAHALFGFALRRGYISQNPVATVEKIESPMRDEVSILTATEAEEVLRRAERYAPELVPYLAIGMFAGLRPMNEMGGLDWKDIDLAGGMILVRRASSKTNRKRNVPISPNLKAWLKSVPLSQREGAIGCSRRKLDWILGREPRRDWRVAEPGKINRAAKEKGKPTRHEFTPLPWDKNIMRHSRTSYRLAETKNETATAAEGGHTPAIMKTHYANRTLPDAEVKKFWSIMPAPTEGKGRKGKAK